MKEVAFGVEGRINRSHLVYHRWYRRLWFWLRRKSLHPVRIIDDITVDSYSLISHHCDDV